MNTINEKSRLITVNKDYGSNNFMDNRSFSRFDLI